MIYHYKMKQPDTIYANIGDGTIDNPFYWYEKTDGQTANINNSNSNDERKRIFLRVKLQSGVNYTIEENFPDGDAYLFFYDGNKNYITENDDWNGLDSRIEYTPSDTGIYIIGAGTWSETGNYTVTITPAPESDPIPQPEIIYHTSTGFNNWGKAIKYRSASLSGCNIIKIPNDGLIFYLPMNDSSILDFYGNSVSNNNVSLTEINEIPCAYFRCNGDNDSFIQLDNYHSWFTKNTFTISFYVKLDSSVSDWRIIANFPNLHLGISPNSIDWGRTGWSGSQYGTAVSCDNINRFVHYCITLENKVYKLYCNGVYGAMSNYDSDYFENSGNAKIGCHINGAYPFKGWISSFRIYNRVLTDKEITALSKEFKT